MPIYREIGIVTHYYNRINVAAMLIKEGEIRLGDTIHISGNTTDIVQKVNSMQIERSSIDKALSGQEIGMKVDNSVRVNDIVYLVEE